MATTTNYSWTTPDNTAYVKDGASAIRTLGSSVDTTLFTALGGAYPGLRLIKTQTILSAVASVNVTSAFSTTYDAYKIVISGGVASASPNLALKLGASTTNYLNSLWLITYSTGATGAAAESAGSAITWAGSGTTSSVNMSIDLVNPFLVKPTTYFAPYNGATQAGYTSGLHNSATSFTDFTITPSTGTLTGGTIAVYGYGKS
jgi:hypothetical protein